MFFIHLPNLRQKWMFPVRCVMEKDVMCVKVPAGWKFWVVEWSIPTYWN